MFSRTLVACLLTAVTVAGCGSSEPDDKAKEPSTSSSSGASPADGDQVSTDTYTYRVPKGWKEPAEKPPGFNFDSVASDPADKDGFADNINVIRGGEAPSDDLGAFEDESVSQLDQLGAEDIKVLKRESVDGDESIHITARTSLNNIEYRTNQYGVIHDGIVYIVTFSFSPDITDDEQSDVIASVLATWKWTS